MKNWEGNTTYWSVMDGALSGEVKAENLLRNNSFIIWRGCSAADFELKGEFRITASVNSDIIYRSEELEGLPFALRNRLAGRY